MARSAESSKHTVTRSVFAALTQGAKSGLLHYRSFFLRRLDVRGHPKGTHGWSTPPPEIALAMGGLVMVKKLTPQAQGRRSDMGNESRRSNHGKNKGSNTKVPHSPGQSPDPNLTISASVLASTITVLR